MCDILKYTHMCNLSRAFRRWIKSNNNLSRYNEIMNVRINNENLHIRQADVIVNSKMAGSARVQFTPR